MDYDEYSSPKWSAALPGQELHDDIWLLPGNTTVPDSIDVGRRSPAIFLLGTNKLAANAKAETIYLVPI